MMDVIMAGTLIVCIVSMLGFTVFCSKQVDLSLIHISEPTRPY